MKNMTLVLIGLILFGIGLATLAGCATVGGYAIEKIKTGDVSEVDYEANLDLYNNRIVYSVDMGSQGAVNYDLFIADRDGTNKRRLTNTPNVDEKRPIWTIDGRIAYWDSRTDKEFIIDEDGKNKLEISRALFYNLIEERRKGK